MCAHVCTSQMAVFFFFFFLSFLLGTKWGNKLCMSLEVGIFLWMHCSYSDPSWETSTSTRMNHIQFNSVWCPPPSAEYHYIPSMWTLTARYVTYLIWSQFSGSELMGWFWNKIFNQGLWLNSWLNSAGFPCPRLQQCHSRVFIKA